VQFLGLPAARVVDGRTILAVHRPIQAIRVSLGMAHEQMMHVISIAKCPAGRLI